MCTIWKQNRYICNVVSAYSNSPSQGRPKRPSPQGPHLPVLFKNCGMRSCLWNTRAPAHVPHSRSKKVTDFVHFGWILR